MLTFRKNERPAAPAVLEKLRLASPSRVIDGDLRPPYILKGATDVRESAIVLSPRGRSDTTQFTRVPYGATNSKLMAGALITTLMREDHLSKASVYRYLGVGDAAQFT